MKTLKILIAVCTLCSSVAMADQRKTIVVGTASTVESDWEYDLNSEAFIVCGHRHATRVGPVRSDYKPYKYFVKIWAPYVCD